MGEESTREASAMRAIAVVTMIFLPATFVSVNSFILQENGVWTDLVSIDTIRDEFLLVRPRGRRRKVIVHCLYPFLDILGPDYSIDSFNTSNVDMVEPHD